MTDHAKIDLVTVFNRVLEARKDTLRSKNNWRVLADVPKTTAQDAFNGRGKQTIDTLERLATAAGMTVAEMLEYGDPDWEATARARALVRNLTDAQLKGLVQFLEGGPRNPPPHAD